MNCPKCKEKNSSDAYFCHNCGKKLRTKINGWPIYSIILFLLSSILGIGLFNYSGRIRDLSGKNDDLQCQIHNMANLLHEKEKQISRLESNITQADNNNKQLQDRIISLETRLPQEYYTKYNYQYLYNKCAGNYEKADCYFPSKGCSITIYTTCDGYGLTHLGGWIPMNRLEKQEP